MCLLARRRLGFGKGTLPTLEKRAQRVSRCRVALDSFGFPTVFLLPDRLELNGIDAIILEPAGDKLGIAVFYVFPTRRVPRDSATNARLRFRDEIPRQHDRILAGYDWAVLERDVGENSEQPHNLPQ